MKVRLLNDLIRTNKRSSTTFVEAGDYEFIRLFDKKRALVDVTPSVIDRFRTITVIPLNELIFIGENNE